MRQQFFSLFGLGAALAVGLASSLAAAPTAEQSKPAAEQSPSGTEPKPTRRFGPLEPELQLVDYATDQLTPAYGPWGWGYGYGYGWGYPATWRVSYASLYPYAGYYRPWYYPYYGNYGWYGPRYYYFNRPFYFGPPWYYFNRPYYGYYRPGPFYGRPYHY